MSNVLTADEFIRLANNFYISQGIGADFNRMALDSQLAAYWTSHQQDVKKTYKVAFLCICLNQLYWPFAEEMIKGARQFFLPTHQTDFFFWTDMPEPVDSTALNKAIEELNIYKKQDKNAYMDGLNDGLEKGISTIQKAIESEKKIFGATTFKTEPMAWPLPTLFRYHFFLEQEERLKDYDYIFYCDVDMKFVNIVGDEILGNGLTASQHPMYALRKEYYPPYEPNEFSASYIKRPGKIIPEGDKKRFMPLYYAGGFQGGKAKPFIEAMKVMKENIQKDYNRGYIPIWNDESQWNYYLSENPPDVVLSPSYIYPDSLIKEYYEPLWGCPYLPKLITLTKKFTTSKEGGEAVSQMLQNNKPK